MEIKRDFGVLSNFFKSFDVVWLSFVSVYKGIFFCFLELTTDILLLFHLAISSVENVRWS